MGILDKIKSPSDVKQLSQEEIESLCGEIRHEIITAVSKNGGHLASNLGIVELTLALHRIFSFPEDSLIFDVGHQAYAHKLVTGRRDRFGTLRKGGGISGFTNADESEYDVMTSGHSGSSLSYAIGIAEANRISGSGAYAVAVIGDGSFTNGMIYEALNNAAVHKLRLIIVLNDNEMSISHNVGALSNYFSRIRTSEAYFNFKFRLKRVFSKIPLIGNSLISAARRIRDFMKRMLITQNMFESLGLTYYGPVAGDNFERLETVFHEAKIRAAESGAVVIHVNTKKGRGFKPAEDFPDKFHSSAPFNMDEYDGYDSDADAEKLSVNADTSKSAEKNITFTDAFSDYIVYAAAKNHKICAVTAAMADGCGLAPFKKWYPERFFDSGIAEEHAVTFAGGLSHSGMKPVVVIYSTFIQRAFDQIWHDISLQGADVVFVISHSGVVAGDGVTHQGIYDVSLLAPIPGISIYSPDSYSGMRRSLDEAFSHGGACAVRYPKGNEAKYDRSGFSDFGNGSIAEFNGYSERGGVLLITYGRIAENVYNAALDYSMEQSESAENDKSNGNDKVTGKSKTTNSGRAVAVVVLRKIVPLDVTAIDGAIRVAERVIFVEEGIRTGGVGEMLAAVMAEKYAEKRLYIRAVEEGFLPHDSQSALIEKIGMDKKSLLEFIKDTNQRGEQIN